MQPQPTDTSVPLLDAIAGRWSPRAFSSEAVRDDDLLGLLEAARWAPSCFGAEPWRFVIGRRGSGAGHELIAECLVPANRLWAEKAPILMVTVAVQNFEYNGEPNRWASHDLGIAMGQLGVEATARNLILHQMGGFDADLARKKLKLPDGFDPLAAVAIGHPGDPTELPEELAEREAAPRSRKPLHEIVFDGGFDTPFQP